MLISSELVWVCRAASCDVQRSEAADVLGAHCRHGSVV